MSATSGGCTVEHAKPSLEVGQVDCNPRSSHRAGRSAGSTTTMPPSCVRHRDPSAELTIR